VRTLAVVATLAAALLLAPASWAKDEPPAQPENAENRRPAPVPPDATPGLVRQMGHDFRNLFSVENAVIIGVGTGLTMAARPHERRITERASGSEFLGDFFVGGEAMGHGIFHGSASLATYLVGRFTDRPRVQHLGGDLIRAHFMNQVLTGGLKLAAQRTRPDGRPHSFPSGHTSAAFVSATVLQKHFGYKVGIPAFAVASYVGGSRVADNHHYLGDVIFGATLGIVAGRTVTLGHQRTRLAITPVYPPGGGAAVQVTIFTQ